MRPIKEHYQGVTGVIFATSNIQVSFTHIYIYVIYICNIYTMMDAIAALLPLSKIAMILLLLYIII